MELISTTTVGAGGISQINITSIPATFTDILVLASVRSDYATTTAPFNMRLNNTVAAQYNSRQLYGNGSSATSGSYSNRYAMENDIYIPGSSSTTNTFANVAIYIPNYAGSAYKTVSWDAVGEGNITGAYQGILAGIWNNTAAITEVNFVGAGNFVQYSTVSIYGILKGSGGATVS